MPTSHLYQLNEIMEMVIFTDPKSILDVGVGFGKFGTLSREYLDIWNGRLNRSDWKIRIDGIEIFKDYISPIHNFSYDNIYIGNVIDIMPNINMNYDLILFIDIIEHLDYQEGIELLEECQKHCRNMIISTPNDIGPQANSFGNYFETHKFQWRKKHFNKFTNKFFVSNRLSIICYIGDDAAIVKKAINYSRYMSQIKEYFPFLKIPYRIVKKLYHKTD